MKKERKGKHFIKKPIYKGGPSALKQFISQQMQYPKEALAQKKEGTVLIRYTINHLGKVVDTKIISGIGFGCDEEADRLVRLLICLLYTSPSPRDQRGSRMPSSA